MGVVLFVLVCGYLPFDGNSFSELFSKIINGQFIVPDFVSDGKESLFENSGILDPFPIFYVNGILLKFVCSLFK